MKESDQKEYTAREVVVRDAGTIIRETTRNRAASPSWAAARQEGT